MRRTIGIVIVVLILVGGGFYFLRQRQASEEPTFEIVRQAIVERGQVQATVNATGSIEPEAMVSLTFGAGGTIQELNAVRGQFVEAGDVLATLNVEELSLAVQQAQDALTIQELTLAQRLNGGPTEGMLAAGQADIDAAVANVAIAEANVAVSEASVLQAQAGRTQLSVSPSAAEIASAQANLVAIEAELTTLETQYNELLEAEIGGAPEEQLRTQLGVTRAQRDAAVAQLNAVSTVSARPGDYQSADASIAASEAQVLAAEGQVLVAEASLARAEAAYLQLLDPPTEEEIAILEAQISSAQTNLAIAELRRDQATIVAPIAGRVAGVLINVGEQASPGTPAITIVNEQAFHIDVSVDEIDIDQVTVGQMVEITLDALPEADVAGTVAEVAPTATATGSGVVSYLVTINLVAEGIALRPGMSANASIVVEEIADVLVVPNWAVRLDRETGQAFVNRLGTDGLVEETTVETGLRNEQFSEVLSGLSEGDEVVVTNEREGFSLFGGDGPE